MGVKEMEKRKSMEHTGLLVLSLLITFLNGSRYFNPFI